MNREIRNRRCSSGERIVWIPGDGYDFEPARQRVVDQQPPGQAFPEAKDFLDDLGRLQGSDDACDRPENAGLCAIGDKPCGGGSGNTQRSVG